MRAETISCVQFMSQICIRVKLWLTVEKEWLIYLYRNLDCVVLLIDKVPNWEKSEYTIWNW